MTEQTAADSTRVQVGRPTVVPPGLPTVPGYEVLRELGRGGMGVVYEARQAKLDRVVALKLTLGDDPLNKARFLAEGQVIAAVKHPHVVEVYDFGESNAGPYIAMEYLPGGTLADRIKAGPAFTPREAAGLVARVAGGVGAAHDAGVVHRDLKPGNVLLAADGTPKVTDFGLAKRAASDLTQTRDAAGTPAYMAPEQAKAMKFVGPPADVWSLGVMLYELLTGRRPFAAETELALLLTIQHDAPPTLRAVAKGIPATLDTVCLKCLEKEPGRRYAAAGELADDLRRWAAGQPVLAPRSTPLALLVLWATRNRTLAGVTAALAVVLVAGVVGVLWFAIEARDAAARAGDALRERDAAILRQKQTAVRFVRFVKDHPQLSGMRTSEVAAIFVQEFPDVTAEDVAAAFGPGSGTLAMAKTTTPADAPAAASSLPGLFGD
ncbi:serine/threonine-protein kinase [Limnoglobus roseus]|uniref:non-specific serine/threonine protein kinase n=1 Tax=Limnoglobus roseus TaxID=2598579 RepID=A0A5C1AKJ2_9BACT|nr:serine/threonine-protein kinase [Limnoglobus roseus]QEL19899.1 serine/threonine protein kinase [Limnoglobus roseus]